jgi:hypothetical protein
MLAPKCLRTNAGQARLGLPGLPSPPGSACPPTTSSVTRSTTARTASRVEHLLRPAQAPRRRTLAASLAEAGEGRRGAGPPWRAVSLKLSECSQAPDLGPAGFERRAQTNYESDRAGPGPADLARRVRTDPYTGPGRAGRAEWLESFPVLSDRRVRMLAAALRPGLVGPGVTVAGGKVRLDDRHGHARRSIQEAGVGGAPQRPGTAQARSGRVRRRPAAAGYGAGPQRPGTAQARTPRDASAAAGGAAVGRA